MLFDTVLTGSLERTQGTWKLDTVSFIVYFLMITFYMILKILSNACVRLTLFTRVSNILMNGLYMHLSIMIQVDVDVAL